jgi:glutamyl-tRNA synthetase
MINETPRVRFAPSPTGYLHVGGLRTALYNYLFAKKNNGTFILRIEDTDRKRYVEGAVENLINSLEWCGLQYEEGPEKEGEYGPYLQSERLALYEDYVLQLVEQKKAYYCFCTAERLDVMRKEIEKAGGQPKYDKHCLNLSREEIKEKLDSGLPYVIRLNVEPGQIIAFDDIIRGRIEFSSDVIDDQVLLKSDGYPTYHLANVVDDHLMRITHVIRGEEWLSSTPKHVILYTALGWEIPEFAHLPLLLNPDRSKLSKRQGDVAVEDYRAKGFLKDALVNFVALLGWTAGDDKEFYHLDELVEAFSLERVNKAGAVFDLQKLHWLNAEHLRNKSIPDLVSLLKESLLTSPFAGTHFPDALLQQIIEVMLPRVSFIQEIWQNGAYLFTAPESYDPAVIKKRWTDESGKYLEVLANHFEALVAPSKEDFEQALHSASEELQVQHAQLIHPLRLAVSGVGGGPGVYDIVVIIGQAEAVQRIRKAAKTITK